MSHQISFKLVLVLLLALLLSACGGDGDDENSSDDKAEPTATVELILPTDNAVEWITETVTLTADNFYITTPGKLFTAEGAEVDVHSDLGTDTYTTLELTWQEHDVEMRLNMYFEVVDDEWQAREIRIYNGEADGEWVVLSSTDPEGDDFASAKFTNPLGRGYGVGVFGLSKGQYSLSFNNLFVQAFTQLDATE